MNWLTIETYTSGARPSAVYWLCICIGIACLIPASAVVAIPAAMAIVLAYIGARSVDKNTDAKVQIAASANPTQPGA